MSTEDKPTDDGPTLPTLLAGIRESYESNAGTSIGLSRHRVEDWARQSSA